MFSSVTLKVVSAELTTDKDFTEGIHSFCTIRTAAKEFKTRVAEGQGTHPVWNDCFQVDAGEDSSVSVTVWDKDKAGLDEPLGETTFNLDQQIKSEQLNLLQPLYQDGLPKGKIYLELQLPGQPTF